MTTEHNKHGKGQTPKSTVHTDRALQRSADLVWTEGVSLAGPAEAVVVPKAKATLPELVVELVPVEPPVQEIKVELVEQGPPQFTVELIAGPPPVTIELVEGPPQFDVELVQKPPAPAPTALDWLGDVETPNPATPAPAPTLPPPPVVSKPAAATLPSAPPKAAVPDWLKDVQ
jgi:hypothetical protein